MVTTVDELRSSHDSFRSIVTDRVGTTRYLQPLFLRKVVDSRSCVSTVMEVRAMPITGGQAGT